MKVTLDPSFVGTARRLRPWAFAGVLVLAGCAGPDMLAERLSIGTEARTAYDRFKPKSLDYAGIANERTEVRKLVDWYGWGVTDGEDGPLSRYLNTILERIVAVSPVPSLPMRVVVVDRMVSPNATAMKDGTILVPMRLLLDMDESPHRSSEDALAFLLAHELSHVLYYHFQSDAFGHALELLKMGTETVHSLSLPQVSGEKLETFYRRVEMVRAAEERALSPAWNRRQENDADLLGFDLMVRAGYNPEAAHEFLEFQRAYEEAAAQRRKMQREAAAKEAPSGALNQWMDDLLRTLGRQHATVRQRREKLNEYHEEWADEMGAAEDIEIRSLGWREEASTGALDRTDAKSIRMLFDNYRAAEQAQEALKAGDRDGARPLISKALSEPTYVNAYPRIVAADYHLAGGEVPEAATHVRVALQGSGPSFHVYERMLWHMDDVEDHLALLDEAEQRFGRFVRLMRLRATALEEAGREEEAQEVRDACYFENALSKQRRTCSEPLEVNRPGNPGG